MFKWSFDRRSFDVEAQVFVSRLNQEGFWKPSKMDCFRVSARLTRGG